MADALKFVLFNERGLRAGWRLTIFISMVVSTAWLVQLATKAAAGVQATPANLPKGYGFAIAQGIAELILFLVVLLFSWIMSRIEHRSVGAYGLPLKKPAWSNFAVGYVFWGFVPLTLLLLIMRALGVFYFGELSLHGPSIVSWSLLWGWVFLLVGLFEEFFFRGYALHTLADGLGFWPAAIIMALVFARAHMGNAGETHVGIIATGAFALFAAATLWRTGNLWLAVGAHAGWDWGQSFFYGVADSGLQVPGHLMNPRSAGPDWLSGGSVGPEGSALTLILWSLMTVGFLVLYPRPQDPALSAPAAPQDAAPLPTP